MAVKLRIRLTPKQEQAVAALLNSPSIPKAAEAIGVGERTLYRWLDDPVFSRAYRKARREAFSHAISITQRYAPAAVTELARVLTDPLAPPSSRVAACSAMLRFGRESIELDELAGRIEVLESAEAAQDQRKGPRLCA